MPSQEVIPLVERTIEEKQEFEGKLQKTRAALR